MAYEEPVNLLSPASVDRLISQHQALGRATGLIIFDMIYQMGVADDNNSKDGIPLMAALKRISRELRCAVMPVGHPGHNSTLRRFRGTSDFRGEFDAEFHMARDMLTCEKQKYVSKKAKLAMQWPYEIDVHRPVLRFLPAGAVVAKTARMRLRAEQELADDPSRSDSVIAELLVKEGLGGDSTIRKYLRELRKEAPGS